MCCVSAVFRQQLGQRDSDRSMADACFIDRHGRRVALKWHRARKHATDTAFTGARIVEGLRCGASIEVDINRIAGGGFAILHDDRLDRETTGSGPVDRASREVLRGLVLRDNDGHPTDQPLMLLDDLAALVARAGAHADALLQLDLKTGADALTPADIAAFRKAVLAMNARVILSSGDAETVAMLAAAAPSVLVGHDPCDDARIDVLRRTGDFAGFVSDALAESPAAEMIYLAIPLVLAADARGFDMVAAFHAAGKPVDAWTMERADGPVLRRLLDLGVDQITTDDPAGLQILAKSL
ncbi:glycerophosphodiester phosphodiesterase [Tabrizicola sp.]|uniref:glycerophosphodiester phosphodiesterase n=1 Tax=Tabrizicola sp. TaxID=2005166 RepID=UPI003F310D7E